MRYKSDKERKEGVVAVRLNAGERRQLEGIRKQTGLTFSGIFRERVLSLEEFPQYKPDAWQLRFDRKFRAICRRGDIDDAEKLKLLSAELVRLEQRGLKMQERQTVTKRHSRRRSA